MKHLNLITTSFFAVALCLFSGFDLANGQVTASGATQLMHNKDWSFVENKGQLVDANGNVHSDIKYYSHKGGPDIYCKPGTISFVFSKLVNNSDGTDADLFQQPKSSQNALDMRRKWEAEITNKTISTVSSRADLVLVNANPNALIEGRDEQAYYENFYTAYTPESGVNEARTYKTIVYKDIYPNIDMLLQTKEGGLEYEFVIRPGGKVSDIHIQWKGLQNLEMLQNGGLHYVNNLLDMQDTKPESFTSEDANASTGPQIASSYVKTDNNVSFAVADYDHSKTLTIDPTLTWGTYLGGGARDYAQAVWTDKLGNIVMSGPWQYPGSSIATSGAFQTSYVGTSTNAFLSKFSASGAIQWCTYYGGTGYNDGWGLSTDAFDDIYMGGATSSTTGMATSGSFQSAYGGGLYGGYGVKFRSNGSRIWGTYYGSTGNDQVLFAATDANANLFLVAWANSATGLASTGAYQTSNAGGTSGTTDVGLAKYDSSGQIQFWSTYYGGSGTEEASSVATDKNGNALICGLTESSSKIATSGAFQSVLGGGEDAFVASFSSNGSLNWGTYLGGSGSDIGWGIATDQFNNVYTNGQTASTSGIASNIPYQPYLYGTNNSFLSKFSPTGTMLWSTYYGGNGSDIANNLCTDPSGCVFTTGNTSSSSGIATPGAYLSILPGAQNAFFSKFSPAGNLMYGSYYGGSGADYSYDIHADAVGNTYFAGQTASSSGIATSGGYQSGYTSATEDCFLAGFHFRNIANDAGMAIMSSGFCSGTQNVTAMLENFGTNDLTSATIGWTLNGKTQTPISWTGKLPKDSIIAVNLGTLNVAGGTDTFKVWSSKPNGMIDSMPENDTLITKVVFVAHPKVYAGGPKKMCKGSSTLVGSTSSSGINYSWTSNPAGFTSSSATTYVSPTATTKYYLTETTVIGGCSAEDSAIVTVGVSPTPRTGDTDTICYGGGFTLGLKAYAGHTYAWASVPAGFSSTSSAPVASPIISSIYYETEMDTTTTCVAYGTTVIIVNPEARANGGGNHQVCPGGSATIGASSVASHTYSWTSVPAGFTSTVSNPMVTPTMSTTYYLADVNTAIGCTSADTAIVALNPVPSTNAGSDQLICAGTNAQIGETSISGDNYSWSSNPTGFTSTLSHPTVNPSATTDYILTETIVATGCTNSDTVIITTNPLPVSYNGGYQNICLGSLVQLGAGNISGHTYSWTSVPKGFTSNSGYPTTYPTQTTTYYLLETISATGCSRKDSVNILVNSVAAHAGNDTTVCTGSPDTLGSVDKSGESYSWTSNPIGFTSAASNPVVKPQTTTIYYLKVTDINTSCSSNDTVVLYVYPLPPADAGTSSSICSGTSVDIGGLSSGSDSFSWISSPTGFSSNSDNPTVSPIVTTTYYLTETDRSTGCSNTNSVKITTESLPNASWNLSYSGDTSLFHAIDGSLNSSAYAWTFGDGNKSSGSLAKHVYANNKAYSVRLTVKGANSCLNDYDSSVTIAYSGFEQVENNNFSFDVFPNPFQSSASIQYNLTNSGKIRIVLFDITGRQVGVIADENQVPGNYQYDLDAQKYHLSPGMYLLKFMKDNQIVSKHVVKM